MKLWTIEAELIGTRTVVVPARSYNEALSKFQNEEYLSTSCRDRVDVDHILSITEHMD